MCCFRRNNGEILKSKIITSWDYSSYNRTVVIWIENPWFLSSFFFKEKYSWLNKCIASTVELRGPTPQFWPVHRVGGILMAHIKESMQSIKETRKTGTNVSSAELHGPVSRSWSVRRAGGIPMVLIRDRIRQRYSCWTRKPRDCSPWAFVRNKNMKYWTEVFSWQTTRHNSDKSICISCSLSGLT